MPMRGTAVLLLLAFAGAQPTKDDGLTELDTLEEAIGHLTTGNTLSAEGRHLEAIAEWRAAARLKPDSIVPWNNMANAYMAVSKVDEALESAHEAFRRGVNYMSSTTMGNVLIQLKRYEEAEEVLLEGCRAVQASGERHEHPCWALANIYLAQGDYQLFVHFAFVGLDLLEHEQCSHREIESCPKMPAHERDIANSLFEACLALGKNYAAHGRLDEALEYFQKAQRVRDSFPQLNMTAMVEAHDSPLQHAHSVRCKMHGRCSESDLVKSVAIWKDTNSRYLRMMPVRVMNCDWRNRAEDELDFSRLLSTPGIPALVNHTLEFFFECDGGMVCGTGGPPPLHMWGFPISPEGVLTMGKVHPIRLMGLIDRSGPTPEWAYPTWDPFTGPKMKIGFISGDLLMDHPVGNMMRAVLPLHDLSRMDVTVFILHEQQQAIVQDPAKQHLIGEVKIVYLGRGPSVVQTWDERQSVEAADMVNSAGICVLFDLIGYTTSHRQDVMALRPTPVQVHYHGYMGSTGAPWIQYYVGDRFIAPPEHTPHFSEKLAYMPESFLGPSHRLTHQFWGASSGSPAEDHSTEEYERATRRVDQGLPSDGALVCYFNQHFKIDPDTFRMWTDALRALTESDEKPPTLWMLAGNAVSQRNIRREFISTDLREDQLVFAKRAPIKEHLRRASLCDIAVDTPMYNSGATAADTLFADQLAAAAAEVKSMMQDDAGSNKSSKACSITTGVPVISQPGEKCVGRMGAGFLNALRMDELLVRDHNEYKRLLLSLANVRARTGRLEVLRRKLARHILRAPFYDINNWVNDFDQQALILWDVHVSTGGKMYHVIPARWL